MRERERRERMMYSVPTSPYDLMDDYMYKRYMYEDMVHVHVYLPLLVA